MTDALVVEWTVKTLLLISCPILAYKLVMGLIEMIDEWREEILGWKEMKNDVRRRK